MFVLASRNLEAITKRKQEEEAQQAAHFTRKLQDQHTSDVQFGKMMLSYDFILVGILVGCICWNAIHALDFISYTCDNETTSWLSSSPFSQISCQVIFVLKITSMLLTILLLFSMGFFITGYPLGGLTVVLLPTLYLFRAHMKGMLARLPYLGIIVAWNEMITYFFANGTQLEWKVKGNLLSHSINVRPFVKYVLFPFLSFLLTVVASLHVACTQPWHCASQVYSTLTSITSFW